VDRIFYKIKTNHLILKNVHGKLKIAEMKRLFKKSLRAASSGG